MSTRLEPYLPDLEERLFFLKTLHQEATKVSLHPELVLAVIEIESSFDRWAISPSGARGLMQIMPFWLNELNHHGKNLFNIQTNLRFGCTILKHYLKKEKNNLIKALARYNGSVGKRTYPDKVLRALQNHWFKR